MTAATLYDWLLFGHIVAAMVWLGGGVLLAALAVATLRGGDAPAVARCGARPAHPLDLGLRARCRAADRHGLGHGLQTRPVNHIVIHPRKEAP